MNRKYSTEDLTTIVKRIRNYYNDVILTTDIIVGFPQESEEEFNKTYEYLKSIKFYKMHVFKYSPRKGTKAANMSGQIDGNIKEQRSQKLIELSNKNEEEYIEKYVCKEGEQSVDGGSKEEKRHMGKLCSFIYPFLRAFPGISFLKGQNAYPYSGSF